MEKRKETLLRNRLFLGGVFVHSRYRILLTSEQIENAKIGLHEVTLKNYHCSTSALNSASSSIEFEKSPGRVASDHQLSTPEEDEFKKEFDWIE